jgi:hypothetical protein
VEGRIVTANKQDETALRMMAAYAEKIAPDRSGRQKAAEKLLEDLLALDGAYGFKVERDRNDANTVEVILNYEGARITAMKNGSLRIARDISSSSYDVTGLEFDRMAGQLVSTSNDDLYEPKFGEPRTRKRTAVAEVIRQVLALMAKAT